jgi:uncharacterized protein YjbI with pentapeptide repeats
MANPEHLSILKSGSEIWNKWRNENRHLVPDLSRLDLSVEDFRRIYFAEINFSKAILTDANLSNTGFINANFKQADLTNSDLSRVNFVESDLSNSCLKGSTLIEVTFRSSILTGSLFELSSLSETVFINSVLSDALGLESCRHSGPSFIDNRTLSKSVDLPREFLMGCGLSDWEIESSRLYNPNLTIAEIEDIQYRIFQLRSSQFAQLYSCYISYSSKDEAFVRKLYEDLQTAGVKCWFAPEDIKAGKKIYEQIDDAIRTNDKLILVLSENSISSSKVAHEIKRARIREKELGKQMLFPISLIEWESLKDWELFDTDLGIDLATMLRAYHIPTFLNWKDPTNYQKSFSRLLKDILISTSIKFKNISDAT